MALEKPTESFADAGKTDASQSSTRTLVQRVREGDAVAEHRLFSRLMKRVRRWARGRLPRDARDLNDTVDVAQDAAVGVWRNLHAITLEHPGDLEAYLRRAVRNRICDEARRIDRKPEMSLLSSQIPDDGPTPEDRAETAVQTDRLQRALARLSAGEREALLGRYEYGYSYDELAELLQKPTATAARMAVNRARAHLFELTRDDRG